MNIRSDMEEIKTASKAKKNSANKAGDTLESELVIFDERFGVTMTVDNSLKRFANDPFIVEQTRRAEKEFSQYESKK